MTMMQCSSASVPQPVLVIGRTCSPSAQRHIEKSGKNQDRLDDYVAHRP